MKVLDLFSGIGGFSLGLERAGMTTVAFCESETYPRKVLQKNFPNIPICPDVRDVTFDDCANLLCIDKNGEVLIQTMGDVMSRKKDTRFAGAVSMYERGMSIGDCADFYGITQQAMHKILIRRGASFRSNNKCVVENHLYRSGEVDGRKRASDIFEKALEKNLVIKKTQCEECDITPIISDGRSGIQEHHDDYNAPLDVRWLCQKCHHEWHRTNKAKGVKREASAGIDVICGGFPCQPFSIAGKQKGCEDERHLWPEMLRIIYESKPTWVIGENVGGFIDIALDDVSDDLESAGYEVQSFIIPACAVNAQHKRERVWIVAHKSINMDSNSNDISFFGDVENDHQNPYTSSSFGKIYTDIVNTTNNDVDIQFGHIDWSGVYTLPKTTPITENRTNRIKVLGNAVVPHIVEMIGRGIMSVEQKKLCGECIC